MNQEELINWLKPIKFNPDVHEIIKSRFKGFCQICGFQYYSNEYITFNREKKKGRHINCQEPSIKNRKKAVWGPRMVKKP